MKKITLCLMLILALIIVPGAIFAAEETAEVDTYQELVDALADSTKTTIKLVGGFELDSTVAVTRTVTIVGGDYEITTKSGVKKSFEIKNTTDEYINVKFQGVTITNATSEGRCIDTRNDNINLTLSSAKLQTTSAQNNQALTLGGTETTGNLKVEMINSSATSAGVAGYGIITFVPGELSIKDSFVTGYAALYVKSGSAGLKVDVINSSLIGENNNTGSDDSFGTIIVEDSNVTINVNKNSTIKSTGKGQQLILGDISTGSVGNKINISSATIDANGEFAYVGNTKTELSVGVGVTSNVNVSEYLPEDVAIEYDETTRKFKIVERTITVDGLENAVNPDETRKILLESFEKWATENPTAAEPYEKTNVIISLNCFQVPDEDVDEIDKEIIDNFKEELNKKDPNANLARIFLDAFISVENDGMGGNLDVLVKPITLKINTPKEDDLEEGYERKYYVIKAGLDKNTSDLVCEDISVAKLSADKKTIEITMSDPSSAYAIAYSDVEKPVVTPPAGEGETGKGKEIKPEVKPVVDIEKPTTPDVPQTGDNVLVFAGLAIVSIVGLGIVTKKYLVKN